jgi:hypothetical protein
VLFHPTHPLVATAGIERDVLLHGPMASSPFGAAPFGRTRAVVRRLPPVSERERRQMRRVVAGLEESGDDENSLILLFDECVRRVSMVECAGSNLIRRYLRTEATDDVDQGVFERNSANVDSDEEEELGFSSENEAAEEEN